MSLEACPDCGHALSTLEGHCRHCAPAAQGFDLPFFGVRHLAQVIAIVATLGVALYLIFWR